MLLCCFASECTVLHPAWNHPSHVCEETIQYGDLMTDINIIRSEGKQEKYLSNLMTSSLPSACTMTTSNSTEELVCSFSVQNSLFFSFLLFSPPFFYFPFRFSVFLFYLLLLCSSSLWTLPPRSDFYCFCQFHFHFLKLIISCDDEHSSF